MGDENKRAAFQLSFFGLHRKSAGGFNGDAPEEFRFETQEIRDLNVVGSLLDDESENSIHSALSALGISDLVHEIIVNTLFFHVDKQRVWVDIARQELRRGQTMIWDRRSTFFFYPPLEGIVCPRTESIWLEIPIGRTISINGCTITITTTDVPATESAESSTLTETSRADVPATESAIDRLEKYKLLELKTVPMWRREETNSNGTIPNSTECAICLQEFQVGAEVRRMPCQGNSWHIFHQYCLAKWLQTSRTCPLCRHPLPPRLNYTL
ncbi:Zinc finger, RING-type [Corchorus olitorius]|uniref:Zinc finger, RING-type n=1 Tax=Corchorus olitorius TaxID=93759 RepID=A0A1R3JFL1_9ROSI|nr:Zinc finger, RING-type [Corchorus olitorius]